ncbi:hypothetical protein KQI84_11565 [bacterium]|nr:hypothetical protein [bacterium]
MFDRWTRTSGGSARWSGRLLPWIAALGIVAACLLGGSAFAEDVVVKKDGTSVRGTVVSWTQASISIQTGGFRLDLPAGQVQDVQIPGANGCEKETVAARSQIAAQRYSQACQTIVSTLQGVPTCNALGEVILQLLALPPGTLSPQELAELGKVSAGIPSVTLRMLEENLGIPRDDRIDFATRALMVADGQDFTKLRSGLLELYRGRLGEAMADSNVEEINKSLVGIAELYEPGLKPVSSANKFRQNHHLSNVERLARAIDLIPLPADLRASETSLMQLMSLAQTPMRSAQDQVYSRLEDYFYSQAEGIMKRFRESGEYQRYLAQFELWKSLLPPQTAVSERIVDISEHMQLLGERESAAFNEYTRLMRMAEAGSPAFVGEIDSQIIRFRESCIWTPERIEQFRQRKEQLAGALAPSAPPETPMPEAEQIEDETIATDPNDPFAGSVVVQPSTGGS